MERDRIVNRGDLPARLEVLYREVDQLSHRLDQIHAGRLKCRRECSSCCVDGITVYEVEAEKIRRHHQKLLTEEKPRAAGACAFLGQDGACRVYEDRPYVCRTQGYPLRWLDEDADGEAVEMRDICPLNDHGGPIEELPEEECWTIGPFEERLAALQFQADGGTMTRIPLRDLFNLLFFQEGGR